MQADKALEAKLWSLSRQKILAREVYVQIIDYLLARLSTYSQQPLEFVGDHCIEEGFFGTTFRGAITPQEAFQITYIGPLGVDFIGDEDVPQYSASLFVFGGHYRISAGKPDRSFIELVYEKGENNVGRWRSLGWQIDEFDEYEGIVENEYYYKESATAAN